MVLRSFLPPVVLIALVLGSILAGWASPTEAAGVGALGAITLAFINLVLLPSLGIKEIQVEGEAAADIDDHAVSGGFFAQIRHFWSVLTDVLHRTALTNAMIFGIFIGATLFSLIFRGLGGDDLVVDFVESLALGSWGLLFIILGIVFVLGFFFDWIEITLIVLPVFAPIIALLDFGDHVDKLELTYWFAILLAVMLQTSFLTPPFGFALFYMKAVAPKEVSLMSIYRGIIPFVMLQLIGVGMVMWFPDIALWLPRILLD
jgi:TRAP-type mannitol/chloroaromatic compound transport system permease large subunit